MCTLALFLDTSPVPFKITVQDTIEDADKSSVQYIYCIMKAHGETTVTIFKKYSIKILIMVN